MLFLGIDIGGTKIAAVVMDEFGHEVLRRRVVTVKKTYSAFLESLLLFIRSIKSDINQPIEIGIAIPGSVSPITKMIKNSNILVINNRDLAGDLIAQLGQNVVLANDANCFALSESCDGRGENYKTVFGLTLGTGCGGGFVIDKNIISGAWGNACECGHIPLPNYNFFTDGPPATCYCGKENCTELFISGTGLESRFKIMNGNSIKSSDIFMLSREGDLVAVKQINLFKEQLARLLAVIVNILDPDIIVIGGGLSNNSDLLTDISS
ncbi:TPA: ROK family protein, partial [Escherichia coli]|nr:ROK family protein [Escherichia coli]